MWCNVPPVVQAVFVAVSPCCTTAQVVNRADVSCAPNAFESCVCEMHDCNLLVQFAREVIRYHLFLLFASLSLYL